VIIKHGGGVKFCVGKEELSMKKRSATGVYLGRMIASVIRINLLIIAYIPSHIFRNFLYKNIFHMNIGKNVVIYYGAEIRAPWNIHIGEGTVIGDKAILDGRSGIKIGKNVNFSTGVWIWTNQHKVNDISFGIEGKPVIIEDRVWLSNRTIILPGVTVGEGAVVAAGAVVTKSVEPFVIAGGVPARKIGEREKQIGYLFHGSHLFFL
jgi:acetyltransferase-like isoleucine patch superfamily enzyme